MTKVTAEIPGQSKPDRAARARLLLPLAVFALLAGLFYLALHSGDPSRLPSALVGRPAPKIALEPVPGLSRNGGSIPLFAPDKLTGGRVSLVNVWASWCAPCHQEHPHLMALQAQGIAIYGINYKDSPEAARRFIGQHGNPYAAIGADRTGRAAIEWGVYAVPETFVVDGSGKIVFKLVGQITAENLQSRLLPAIARVRQD